MGGHAAVCGDATQGAKSVALDVFAIMGAVSLRIAGQVVVVLWGPNVHRGFAVSGLVMLTFSRSPFAKVPIAILPPQVLRLCFPNSPSPGALTPDAGDPALGRMVFTFDLMCLCAYFTVYLGFCEVGYGCDARYN